VLNKHTFVYVLSLSWGTLKDVYPEGIVEDGLCCQCHAHYASHLE